MRFLLALLITALIVKDTIPLPYPQLWRGIAQGLCLVTGSLWLATRFSSQIWARYWPILVYVGVLTLSALASSRPLFVMLQVGSFFAVTIFFIAYSESQWSALHPGCDAGLRAVTLAYALALTGSLILLAALPDRAYEFVQSVGQRRFRGAFAEPGMMANAAGLLVGLSVLWLKKPYLKVGVGVIALTCLALTLSRTNWIATLAALIVTAWIYKRDTRRLIVLVTAVGLFCLLSALALGINLDTEKTRRVLRVESLATLSGRVDLWRAAFEAFKQHPALGNGFTAGAAALAEMESASEGQYLQYVAKLHDRYGSLHNGFVQASLDSGAIGLFCYVLIIIITLYRLYRYDKERLFVCEFYILLYATIANLGKNFIYSASVLDSVVYWMVAVFALRIRHERVVKIASGTRPTRPPRHWPNILAGG